MINSSKFFVLAPGISVNKIGVFVYYFEFFGVRYVLHICLVQCLNPLGSETDQSIFFKRNMLKSYDIPDCVLHFYSSRYDVRKLHNNDKSMPSY
jgi:hypothetical protein